ncbi:hypothetical protein P67b_00066 [Ruegeria phage Tedan]|nr:hypothetical protein P67b_00066 [Ruegeria phage Tedan]
MTEKRYEIGRRYKTLGGEYVLLEGHGGDRRDRPCTKGTTYETVFSVDDTGKRVHRYSSSDRTDAGRVTGSNFGRTPNEPPDPRNLVWPPEPMDMDGSYCVTEGGEVCRRPKHTETGIQMGFVICQAMHDDFAEEIAEALNLHRLRYPEEHD